MYAFDCYCFLVWTEELKISRTLNFTWLCCIKGTLRWKWDAHHNVRPYINLSHFFFYKTWLRTPELFLSFVKYLMLFCMVSFFVKRKSWFKYFQNNVSCIFIYLKYTCLVNIIELVYARSGNGHTETQKYRRTYNI